MEPVTPRRSTFDLPKPETGLAEWTSKIKALQRQVDADEEAEQRRLEDEIAASRKARLRRSKGVGYGGDSLDLSNSSAEIASFTSKLDNSPSTGAFKSSSDRQNDHDDALRKLIGASASSNIDTSSITSGVLPRPSQYPTTPASQRADPVSLASFIGGRATGPRLNRHAPQQDAHDPTQFEQRTFTAPHPIFGQGGVAMPGMATKPSNSRDAAKASDAVERYQPRLLNRTSTSSLVKQVEDPSRAGSPFKTGSRDRTISTPSVARKYLAKVEQRPASPEKPGFRERKISTPGTPILGAKSSDTSGSRRSANEIPPTPEMRPKTPTRDRWSTNEAPPTTEVRPKTPSKDRWSTNEVPLRTEMRPKTPTRDRTLTSAKAGEGLYTPRQVPQIINTPATPAIKSISSIPSLARPIQPEPRSLSQISTASSNVPSPAFLRSSPQKDPTPSISRLQGRGFVQNMVKASSQLENSTKAAPSPPERTKPVTGRKSTVLDRWQPNATSLPSSPASKETLPKRKSFTVDATSSSPATKSSIPPSVPPSPTPSKALKTKVSFPNMLHPDPLIAPEPLSPRRAKLAEKMLPPEGSPGFGSATTMVVYKPTKGEATSQPTKEPVDELGVKNDSGRENKDKSRSHVSSDISTPSGKPLNHPTKERPRKPKKNRDASGGVPPTEAHAVVDPINDPGPSELPSVQLQSFQFLRASSPLIGDAARVFSSRADRTVKSDRDSENDSPPKVSHLAQQWGQNAPIGLKPVSPSTQAQSHSVQPQIKGNSNLIRRALPGMTGEVSLPIPHHVAKSKTPSPEQTLTDATKSNVTQQSSPSNSSGYTGSTGSNETYSSASPTKGERAAKPPPSPKNKHSRIPSTGNRALVMDVAQALNEHVSNEMVQTQDDTFSVPEKTKMTSEPVAIPRHIVAPSMERRKSSYDRFSLVSVMPPLKEEATPNATPYGSINRVPANQDNKLSSIESGTPFKNGQHGHVESVSTHGADVVHFDLDNRPLPSIDLTPLLQQPKKIVHFTDAHTISVEVFVVNGGSTTSITQDMDVFYDSEVLAIVHRYKSKSSGLVAMQLWQWNGIRSNLGEKEERKLQELAKRYNASPILVRQNSEPAQMVQLLGGKLITRQGSRSHWSADNTAMYSIRMLGGVVYIDEHDLSAKNLCSAFSFCVVILDTIYVWHGCGSTDAERQAACQYGARLTKDGTSAIELHEGEDEGEELFWMALGDDEFAKAHYWRWRRDSSITDPRIWRLDCKAQLKPTMIEVSSFGKEAFSQDSIYMIDSIWELFVVVGKQARGDRFGIRIAVDVAKRVSKVTGSSKPFTPPIHVLVLPSMLPVDLRLNLREMDEAEVNNHDIPDHMNLLSCVQAENHLQQHTWERIALKDQTMLPLGISTPVAQ